jgi:cell division protein FtsQ
MSQAVSVPMDVRLMNLTALALLGLFSLLALGAMAAWASGHPVFAIRGMTISGDVTHNNAATLRANVAPRLNGTFFTMDLGQSRQAFEAVPWVRHAVVRREFPNRLRVMLQEHRAVGFWGPEGDSRLVNEYGEVFEANVGEVEQDGLPRLNGPDGHSAQALALHQALRPLFSALDATVEQLELSPRGSWRARLDSGAVLELGGGSQAEVLARTQRFLKTLTQVVSRYGRRVEALETADLRHEDGYALRLRGVTTGAPDGQKK